MRMDITYQRGPSEANGTDQEHGQQHETEHWSIGVGCPPDDCQDYEDHTDDAPR